MEIIQESFSVFVREPILVVVKISITMHVIYVGPK